MSEIINMISSVGFPIVMTLLMFWRIEKQDQEHKDEIGKLSEAIQNNTNALIKLSSRLGV